MASSVERNTVNIKVKLGIVFQRTQSHCQQTYPDWLIDVDRFVSWRSKPNCYLFMNVGVLKVTISFPCNIIVDFFKKSYRNIFFGNLERILLEHNYIIINAQQNGYTNLFTKKYHLFAASNRTGCITKFTNY